MSDTKAQQILSKLGVLLLEKTDAGFTTHDPTPAWAASFSIAAAIQDPAALFPFLSGFMSTASIFWEQNEVGECRSGTWIETDANGIARHLHATAMRVNGSPCLLIQESDQSVLSVLQVARESRLRLDRQLASGQTERQRLLTEGEAARAMNEELDRRVKERTVALAQANELLLAEVAERKQAAAKLMEYQRDLRALSAKVSVAEEQERRRIARGLHDHIGQTLAVTQLKLRTLHESAGSDTAAALEAVHPLLDNAIRHIRTLTFELGARVLYEFGLGAAIESLVEQLNHDHGLSATFDEDDHAKPLGEDAQVALYQGARELLHNVVKHARADSVSVTLARVDSSVRLAVKDNGVGCAPELAGVSVSRNGGFGLFSIRERLDYLGGALSISSAGDRGTVATLSVPIMPDSMHVGEAP